MLPEIGPWSVQQGMVMVDGRGGFLAGANLDGKARAPHTGRIATVVSQEE